MISMLIALRATLTTTTHEKPPDPPWCFLFHSRPEISTRTSNEIGEMTFRVSKSIFAWLFYKMKVFRRALGYVRADHLDVFYFGGELPIFTGNVRTSSSPLWCSLSCCTREEERERSVRR